MVTIATFNEPDKAKRLKQRFQETGIKTDIHNERHLQQMAFMSRPQANAKVMVDDADFERAQNLMIEWESRDPDIAAVLRVEEEFAQQPQSHRPPADLRMQDGRDHRAPIPDLVELVRP